MNIVSTAELTEGEKPSRFSCVFFFFKGKPRGDVTTHIASAATKQNKSGFVARFITCKGIKKGRKKIEKAEFPLQSHTTLRLLDQSVACNPSP